MNKTSYEKEGLNSLNDLFEKLIKCSEENDTKGTMRIVSSLTEEEKDYMYSWAKEQNNLAKVAGIVVEAEMAKKAFDIDCRFKKQVLEALPIQGYCLENDPSNPDSLGADCIKFTDNKYINGKIDLRNRKVYLEARDAENKKYEKTIDYSEVEDLMESINHFRKDIEETFQEAPVVQEEVKEEPFDILNNKEFMKQIGADWAVNLAKKADSRDVSDLSFEEAMALDPKDPRAVKYLAREFQIKYTTASEILGMFGNMEDAYNEMTKISDEKGYGWDEPEDTEDTREDSIDEQLKEDGLSKDAFTDKMDVNFYISLCDYGIARNPKDGMTLLGTTVREDEFGNSAYVDYTWKYISLDDVRENLKDQDAGFWRWVGVENPEQEISKLDNNGLAYWIYSINQYNGGFSPTASAKQQLNKKADSNPKNADLDSKQPYLSQQLNEALESPLDTHHLLRKKVITREDGESFTKAVNRLLRDPADAYHLLDDKIITKEDGELYTEVLNKASEGSYSALNLLKDKVITKEDGEVFTEALNHALVVPDYALDLLKDKVITKEDGELYTKVLDKALENSYYKTRLLEEGIITQEEVEEQPQGGKSASIKGGLGKKAEDDYNYNLKPIKISWDSATKDTFIEHLSRTTTVGGDHGDVSFSPSSCDFEDGAIIINDGTLYSTWVAISEGEYSPEEVAEGIIQDSFDAIGVLDTLDISERDIHNLKDE